MEETNMSIMNAVLFTFLGWLLGMLSPIVVNAIVKRYRNKEIRRAILTELDDARLYFTCEVYIIGTRYSVYDKQLLGWVLSVLENYKGPNPAEKASEIIKDCLALSNDRVAALEKIQKAGASKPLSLKK